HSFRGARWGLARLYFIVLLSAALACECNNTGPRKQISQRERREKLTHNFLLTVNARSNTAMGANASTV
ncbi:MAG: hypothetical protein LBJ12_08445, partial [Oscillospiraceae bacterium]|nr:hypothetical protein [Oscillospiraceae bacterium]